MKSSRLPLLLFILVFALSCRREESTRWQVDTLFPVAYGRLTLDDMIPDTLLEADDTGLWHFVLKQNLTDFNLDSLVAMPDTIIRKKFENPLSGGPFPIPAGQQIINASENNLIALNNVQLKEVRTKSGWLEYSIKSYTNAYLNCTYTLPGVTMQGVPTVLVAETPPGSSAQPAVVQGVLDLSGYRIDLTGQSGFSYNRIASQLNVTISDQQQGLALIYGHDSIAVELHFVEPKVSYARGYFGQHQYSLNREVSFGNGVNMPKGAFNVDQVTLDLSIENYVGVDAQIDFDAITGTAGSSEVTLQSAEIYNPINITRAQDVNGTVTPVTKNYHLTEGNSNLDLFIENLPTGLRLEGQVNINPMGDISAGNDFIYTDQAFNSLLHIDLPLCVGMNGLTLTDTLEIKTTANIQASGIIYLDLVNAFPFSAHVNLAIADSTGQVLTALLAGQSMSAAALLGNNTTLPAKSTMSMYLTAQEVQLLKAGNQFILSVVLNTPTDQSTVKLYRDYFIDFKLRTNALIEIEVK